MKRLTSMERRAPKTNGCAQARDELRSLVHDLTNIFNAHDAIAVGELWTEPLDISGPSLLCSALYEAFTIGKLGTENPI